MHDPTVLEHSREPYPDPDREPCQADRDFKETALADVSRQLTVARATSERTVGEWQARSESKEAAVLTAKTNEIAGLQEQHARRVASAPELRPARSKPSTAATSHGWLSY
jgi:hypothetical protein